MRPSWRSAASERMRGVAADGPKIEDAVGLAVASNESHGAVHFGILFGEQLQQHARLAMASEA